ncbi:transthyretin-like isoform X1 [Acipenser oxyrinchus oxyrinchus]|uniref:Transthyretin n=1 Tax=Acipenser oxyrinchus oxyrinchus TaxID=40147 RepID=A0AAD8GGB5_ACIOX|nr:transthyretin-like isoform X1 [Acipenser oxyrinchus oxyrinchus]
MVTSTFFVVFAVTAFLCNAAPLDHKSHGETDSKCPLMVKVLDAVMGILAANVAIKVHRQADDKSWQLIASGVTDDTGEVHNLIPEADFTKGMYKVELDTKSYWKSMGVTPFHEVADVVFEANNDGHRHYTLAVLLSPFSYTTTAVISKAHE